MSLLTDGIILSFMTNFPEKRNWLEFSTREISVEPFKLNKRPGRLLDHLRYHIFPVCSDAIYPGYWRFFLAASPLVSSAFGRRNDAPQRTREKTSGTQVRCHFLHRKVYLHIFGVTY